MSKIPSASRREQLAETAIVGGPAPRNIFSTPRLHYNQPMPIRKSDGRTPLRIRRRRLPTRGPCERIAHPPTFIEVQGFLIFWVGNLRFATEAVVEGEFRAVRKRAAPSISSHQTIFFRRKEPKYDRAQKDPGDRRGQPEE